jgi:protein gp37
MSDLFHEDVPPDYIGRVGDVMRRADWHVFQVLTKRDRDRFVRTAVTAPAFSYLRPIEDGNERLVDQTGIEPVTS